MSYSFADPCLPSMCDMEEISGLGEKLELMISKKLEVCFCLHYETEGRPVGNRMKKQNIFPAAEGRGFVCFEVYSQQINLIHMSISMIILTNNKIFVKHFTVFKAFPHHLISSFHSY